MKNALAMFLAAGGYIKKHPEEAVRAVRNVTELRFGLPIAALRWFAGRIRGKKAPKDVEVFAVPPGIRAGATIDLMGTEVRATSTVVIERVSINAEEMRFEIRISDVTMEVLGDGGDSPIAALLKSGALDLSKPGNLAAYMPKRPEMLVEAVDDLVVLDLMKHPKIAGNAAVRAAIAAITPVLSIRAIETDPEHLDVLLRLSPAGVTEAVAAALGAARGDGPELAPA